MAREVNLGMGTGKSLDELAALMAAKRGAPDPQLGEEDDADEADDIEEVVEEDDDADDVDGEDEDAEGGELVEEADEADDADDDASDEDDDEDADDGELEVDEDTLIELDGEKEPVSLKTLKEVFQADKTVVERVKQTEAAYIEATQARSKAIEDNTRANEALTNVVKAIDSIIGQSLIQRPNAALKTSNPAAYWAQFEAFQNDQVRIHQSRQAVLAALNEHTNKVKETRENFKLREMAVLAQKLPALRDEKTKTQATRDILDAAAAYGFSPEEVEAAGDHRIYQMAYDAQQYRKLKSAGKQEKEERVTKLKQKISQQPKVLRSNGTSADSRSSIAEKRVKVLRARAVKSGRTEDVAAFMGSRRQVAS